MASFVTYSTNTPEANSVPGLALVCITRDPAMQTMWSLSSRSHHNLVKTVHRDRKANLQTPTAVEKHLCALSHLTRIIALEVTAPHFPDEQMRLRAVR